MKWEKTTIGAHCTVTSSKRFHLSERSHEGIPFFCSKEIIQKVNGQEVLECDYIREDLYENIKNKFGVPCSGDLLITSRGTYGIPYIYQDNDKFYFADGNLTWLKDFDNNLKATFLYYWIRSHEGQKKIDAIAKGTAQKALTIDNLKNIELFLPTVVEQKRIVDILSSYDNLIKNNQKQIKLLEEAAQRLYKEWFVDLRFPGYETTHIIDGIPQGWKKVLFGEIIGYEIGGGWGEDESTDKCDQQSFVIRGTDLYDITHGKAKSIPCRYQSESSLKSRILQDGDVVFEVSGGSRTEGVARTAFIRQFMLDFWGTPVICASFCKLIRFKDKQLSQYMYDTLQYLRNSGETVKYDKRSASSIVNYRWKDFLEQEVILVPPHDILQKYNKISESMYSMIISKSQATEKSAEARDRLLPKLISGEIEV